MFTDVVGFTAIMERSEDEAMRVLSLTMEIVQRVVESRGGRVVKEMGDGTLSVFSYPHCAVLSARDIINNLENSSFKVRIGIHCGSVLFEGGDVFGDTVNVASRLEKKAPGGSALLSWEVLSLCKAEERPDTVDLGLTRLKGLGRLLQIFCIGIQDDSHDTAVAIDPPAGTGPLVLCVFPLENRGGPEDEFYSFGITADLLSDLSRAGSISIMPITALMRSLECGETPEDTARRLGSSAIVQGTIERVGTQMKLNLCLKEVESDRTVWADTWLEEIRELPALKGKLADSILKALGRHPEVYPGITEVAAESATVYEKYLQALHLWKTRQNRQQIQEVRDLLDFVIQNEPEMIPAMVLLGETYRDSGDYTAGLRLFREALAIAGRNNSPVYLLSATTAIGITHWMKGDLDEAQKAYTQSMNLAKQLNDQAGEARALNNMGIIYCDRSLFEDSLSMLEKSLEISNRLGLRSIQANTLCNMGLVHWRSGDGARAIEFYEKSLDILKSLRDQAGEANLLLNIGIIYNDQGSMELAYNTAQRSMELARIIDDRSGTCRALNNMGNVMLALGLFTKAEKHYLEALVLARQIGIRLMEGIAQKNFAFLKSQTGDIAAARENCEKALSIAEEIDDKVGIIDNCQLLADILLRTGEAGKALEVILQASALCDSYDLPRYIPSIRTDLALCLLKTGASVEQVTEQLEKAQTIKIEDTKSLPEICWKWAIINLNISNRENLPAERRQFSLEESAKWRQAAVDSILSAAENINSGELKHSFLNSIPLNRQILEGVTR